ncbi:MAG: glycosyltransferase [Acidimicrobiales bacterium]
MNRLIVVSVGTDHHPFDRLVTMMDSWALTHPGDSVIIQYGTAMAPTTATGHKLIPHPELCDLFGRADVVICHGGPSTVMDARMAGKKPLVLPRDPARGEHVDGHQIRFAKHIDRHGLARTLNSEDDIAQAIEDVLADPLHYSIASEQREAPPGVVQFGRAIDDLLGTSTPLVRPSTPQRETPGLGS